MDDLLFLVIFVVAAIETYIIYEVWPFAREYLKSMNKPTRPLMFLFQKNRILRLLTGKYIAQTYEYESGEELLAFSKNDAGSFTFGKAIVDIFYDAGNMAQRPEFWLICHAFMQAGYKGWDEVKAALSISKKLKSGTGKNLGVLVKGKFVDHNGIKQERVMEISDICPATINDPEEGEIYIPLFSQVNPHETLAYVEGTASIYKGYADTKLNIERAQKFGGILNNPSIMAMGFIIICAGVALGIMKALRVF